MDLKLLEEIGLTDGEVKVYLALLKLGTCKTGPLVKAAGVSSSKVYKILDRLEAKGLAGHVLKGKVKHFVAQEPRRIVDYIDEREAKLEEKKEQIEKMLPELERYKALRRSEAVLYEGYKAVTNFFRSMVDELGPGEEYKVIGAGYYGEEIQKLRKFFLMHHGRRAAKKIGLKMLANHDVKGALEKTTLENAKIRYLPQYLITNMEIVFYKDKTFIVMWTKEPVGVLIQNEEAVKSFEAYFNALWKIARE
jgi:sugar-specific transcriptional regulator TrmB